MKGDFTRFTHDPKKHYTGILKQQGRVDLDADWNEYVAIQDHLRQTTMADLIGPCGVPQPRGAQEGAAEAFRVTVSDEGEILKLSLDPGRIYVDGILCELEAKLSQEYLPTGENGQWECQPNSAECRLRLPRILTRTAGQTDLFYLEVWQRHVTAVEDPAIREVALGGTDTATRVQTVWLLKTQPTSAVGSLGPNASLPSCDDVIEGWPPAASAGRLSVSVDAGAQHLENPCLIGAEGGYQGLENRLYRVEIHDDGEKATFKWSRDNGAVVFPVSDVSGNKLSLTPIGRDGELSLKKGDWVEIIDDAYELSSQPGVLQKIAEHPDAANRIITLDAEVPEDMKPDPSGSQDRHLRVRRWEGTGSIEVDSPEEDPSYKHDLENGIKISFAGDNFKSGDYWVFPARTATGAIQRDLKKATADGIRRHYCKLALVTWPGDARTTIDIQDCRRSFTFPPLAGLSRDILRVANCCTVRVGEGGEYAGLSAAIESLGDSGGRICLLPGEHRLPATVVIQKNNVVIVGCGPHASVIGPAEGPALLVKGGRGVRFEALWIETASSQGVIRVDSGEHMAEEITITDCRLVNTSGGQTLSLQAQGIRIVRNVLNGSAWIRDGSSALHIADNEIAEGNGAGIALGGLEEGEGPLNQASGVVEVSISDNRIRNMGNSGIAARAVPADASAGLGDLEELYIAANRISGCARAEPQDPLDPPAIGGIVLHNATGVHIHGNTIVDNGAENSAPACGVFLNQCQRLDMVANTIRNNGLAGSHSREGSTRWQGGIVALFLTATDETGQADAIGGGSPAVRIHDNTVVCPSGHSLILMGMGSFSVIGNTLTSHGRRMQPGVGSEHIEWVHGVYIANLGSNAELPEFIPHFGINTRFHFDIAPDAPFPALTCQPPGPASQAGWILLQGNQVTFEDMGSDTLRSAVAVLSVDDVSVQNNQFNGVCPAGMHAHVFVSANTVRASDNRFQELPGCAVYSYYSWGVWNTAIGNQATHCLLVEGSDPIKQNNHERFTDRCRPSSEAALAIDNSTEVDHG